MNKSVHIGCCQTWVLSEKVSDLEIHFEFKFMVHEWKDDNISLLEYFPSKASIQQISLRFFSAFTVTTINLQDKDLMWVAILYSNVH